MPPLTSSAWWQLHPPGDDLRIRVGVNISWFLILFLAIIWLRGAVRRRGWTTSSRGSSSPSSTAFGFFGSILLHELGHAVVARRDGIEVTGIDLFFFGGVMKMSRDTRARPDRSSASRSPARW